VRSLTAYSGNYECFANNNKMAPSNTAEDTIHYTDHSTGMKIEIL